MASPASKARVGSVFALRSPLPTSRCDPAAAADAPAAGSIAHEAHIPTNLWLAIYLFALPLESLPQARSGTSRSRASPIPVVVYQEQGRQSCIVDRNHTAAELGIHPGMSLAAAHTLAAALRAYPRDVSAEQQALTRLAAWTEQFTPKLAIVPPHTLLLEIAGSLRLFHGLHSLLESVRRGLLELGHQCRLAVCPTPLGAQLLARADGATVVTDIKRLVSAVGPLSIDYLDIGTKGLTTLRRSGVHCLADLFRLPREGLASRIGPQLPSFIDRLLGRQPDPMAFFSSAKVFKGTLALPTESHDANVLLAAARQLLLELVACLRSGVSAVSHLEWRLTHPSHPPTTIEVDAVEPSRDADILLELLRLKLEHFRLIGPVSEITLATSPFQHHAGESLEAIRGSIRRQEMERNVFLQRLRTRLGLGAISGIRLVDEHRPERAWRSCPPGEGGGDAVFGSRPLWLLKPPMPLKSRNGRPYRNGPLQTQPDRERISTGWWDDQPVDRDYFIAHGAKGGRYWVYRDLRHPESWYLHGIFA